MMDIVINHPIVNLEARFEINLTLSVSIVPDLATTNRNVHNASVLIYLDKHTKRHQGHLMMYLPHAIYNVNAWWIDLNSHLTVMNRIHFMEGCDIHIHIHSNVDYGSLLSTIN